MRTYLYFSEEFSPDKLEMSFEYVNNSIKSGIELRTTCLLCSATDVEPIESCSVGDVIRMYNDHLDRCRINLDREKKIPISPNEAEITVDKLNEFRKEAFEDGCRQQIKWIKQLLRTGYTAEQILASDDNDDEMFPGERPL